LYIIIGHSAGGVFNQILLDHGFGAAGVAIDSAPTEGREGRSALPDQVRVGHRLPMDFDELERWTGVEFERRMRSRKGEL